jgi:hypothetical protein
MITIATKLLELLLVKHVTCKNIIASIFVKTIVVVDILRTLHYPTHTSNPFQKKIRSTPQHTHYTPKPNHEKATKTSIKFDDIDKWVHYGQKKSESTKKRFTLIINNNGNAKHSLFLVVPYLHTHTNTYSSP